MAGATARVVVLMPPEEKEAVAEHARRAGVSLGEFIRRSVAEQISDAQLEAELERRRPEIEALLDQIEASHAGAMASVDAAIAAIDAVRTELRSRRGDHGDH